MGNRNHQSGTYDATRASQILEPNLPTYSTGNTMPGLGNRVFEKSFECLVTKEQLAGSLALSRSYISKLMATEGLPHLKIGRAVRFRVSEVVAWLQKRSQP